ncbi:MAG TPA: ATP-dependent helicase HrpB [Gammaproteobacteria bacterium]|nr:ATP-dependent helicase HrpB [Gammaproteobacteria bacterium]
MSALPIDFLLPEIRTRLAEQMSLVIEAPPGAGKTTRVPPALLNADWLQGRKLVMLEPRRLAARAAAHYMAAQLGEAVGETIGYRVRMDTRVGSRTRIEVVTEGVLTRLLQSDAALSDYGLVIFDEFHERSLHADLSLALCLEVRQVLRPDLRLLVMSATLDGAAVARLLNDAPRLISEGRSYPVDTRYRPLAARAPMEAQVANAVRRVLAEETGSLLVFLPGGGEIRRVAMMLQANLPEDVGVTPLYGDLPQAAQDKAILPAAHGRRKVVLASSIAETSLTIEGVRVVVDAGLARVPRFDPVSGLTRLVTVRVSRASADQRRGRAGRQESGVCYRLWSEGERLAAQGAPEILQTDLAPLALELAQWGAADAGKLAWLDPPPAAALSQARDLLHELEALGADGQITAHGRQLLELPLHPRLAHMVMRSAVWDAGWLACLLAALLSERDIFSGSGRHADVAARLRLLTEEGEAGVHADRSRLKRVRAIARDIARQARIAPDVSVAPEQAGQLLALAYPDRIARRRPGKRPRHLLANGRGAYLSEDDALSRAEWLAVAALDGDAREARIFLAARLDERQVRELFATQFVTRDRIDWDEDQNAVRAVREQSLGAIIVEQRPLPEPDAQRVAALMLAAIRREGLDCLPWTTELRNWQARVQLLRRVHADSWPDVSDPTLLRSLEQWLAPYLAGRTRCTHLADMPLRQALDALLDFRQRRGLEELAPTHFTVPTGSRIALDYTSGETPVLAVRVQELFGLAHTPAIAGGRVPLVLHLLSPAGRPLQITRDLAGFWKSSYQDVKKDMQGRYPKHAWPDDPLTAEPTRRAKRK